MNWQRTCGFSLVELTLALGVAAFCLLAVFGLMPIGVQTNRNATSQTRATNIMAGIIADLRATSTSSTTSAQFGITFGTCKRLYFDSEGQVTASGTCDETITLPPTSRYQLNVTWNVPNSTGACSAVLPCADLRVTWPAAVDPTTTTPNGSAEMFAAFDRR